MNIIEIGEEIFNTLHKFPEVSGSEIKTRQILESISKKLKHISVVYRGEEGLVLGYYAETRDKEHKFDLAFRAELDALELPTGKIYHGCGHDGHMAALMMLVLYVEANGSEKNLLFVFQSGEEIGNGANKLVNIMINLNIHVKSFFDVHNAPEINTNTIAVRSGKVLSNNYTNAVQVITKERGHFNSNISNIFGWEGVYDEIFNLSKEQSTNMFTKVGKFKTNGQIGVQADQLEFTISLRSYVWSIKQLKVKFGDLIRRIKQLPNIERVFFHNINEHYMINNDNGICELMNRNPDFRILEVSDILSSDDFGYYNQISEASFYFFVGSYVSHEHSKLHTKNYLLNKNFLTAALKIYIYILKEAS
ncbi:MAG: N-acyl-L-amino acid amidohydrolase [Bacillales bacterium]|jgi:metal-dependent amidase/aminoacylase/carboxypeptidase family protein|nr:N-acyl-L-amino acid amidohydrolase [Bacillales bacterium]